MIALDPDPRYAPPDDEAERRAVLLERARRCKRAQRTACLAGFVLGLLVAIAAVLVGSSIAAPSGAPSLPAADIPQPTESSLPARAVGTSASEPASTRG